MLEMITTEMIISGVVSGVLGYLLPQPKWVTLAQMFVSEWIKKKF